MRYYAVPDDETWIDDMEISYGYIREYYDEIMACKDCIYGGRQISDGRRWCERYSAFMNFCSEGVRKHKS